MRRKFTRRGRMLRKIKKIEYKLEGLAGGILAGGIAGEVACFPFLGPGALVCAAGGAAIGGKAGLVEGDKLANKFLRSKEGIKLGRKRK